AFGDGKPVRRAGGVLVYPPGDEVSDPGVRVRVGRGTHVRPHAARAAVAAEHVPELLGFEVRELVEADEGDLRALPVEDVLLVLEVRELDGVPCGYVLPLEDALARLEADGAVDAFRLVPEAAFVADLDACAAEDDGAEAGDRRQVAQGFEEEPVALPAACGSAVDDDVRAACEEGFLGSGLGPDGDGLGHGASVL